MATVDIEQVLPEVSRPARYTGGEWNSAGKEWDAAPLRAVLACPDVYEAGATDLTMAIGYHLLNLEPDVLCERSYVPWPDMEAAMRGRGFGLWSLESRHAVTDFDLVLFPLVSELAFASVVNLLDLAGLPLRSAEREGSLPLLLGLNGGPVGPLNPEPLADFLDAFALGDPEALLPDIVDLLRRWKEPGGGAKAGLLRELARLPGLYVPSLYEVRYGKDGAVMVEPAAGAPERVAARWLESLPPPPTKPVVPFVQTLRSALPLEISRGAGTGPLAVRRPVLERPPAEVAEAARELLASTGYGEIALSGVDHSRLGDVAEALVPALGGHATVVLPPLPPAAAAVAAAAALTPEPRRRTIAFDLEAVADEQVLTAAEAAFERGWYGVRLSFRLGRPGEALEDALATADLAARVKEAGRRRHGGRTRVRVSAAAFVPRSWTPFQWAPQAAVDELRENQEAFRRACRRRGVEVTVEDPQRALLEGVLARGDRHLGAAVERAWRLGARVEAERQQFDWSRWERALAECGLDADSYTRERGAEEKLPWSHLEAGVGEAELRGEWRRTAAAPKQVS